MKMAGAGVPPMVPAVFTGFLDPRPGRRCQEGAGGWTGSKQQMENGQDIAFGCAKIFWRNSA
jgi:hypothetical protein